MISLTKYISNIKKDNVIITFENELEYHFYAEFILGISFNHSLLSISEQYGAYIGQKELIIDLAKEIYSIIRNHEPIDNIKLDKDDISGYDNIFFDNLEIQFTNKNTGYIANKSNYNKDKKIFDLVYIEISIKDYSEYKDLVRCIMHEILHAWNNYQSYVKGSQFNLKELTNKNSKYYKTLFDGSLTVSNICKRICNNISKIEQNAYLSELSSELDINKFNVKEYSNINDAYNTAYEIFKKSDVWEQYSALWNYLINLNDKENNKEEKIEFEKTYNEINSTSLSFNQIYKRLNDQFNKIFKKLEKNVPKIFYDYYEKQMNELVGESVSGRQNKSLIDFIKYINEYDLLESVKANNGKEWEVYLDNYLDKTFTDNAKHWKKYPKVGNGWYCGGTVFKIIKIEDNKVYVKDDNTIKP